MTVTVPSRGFIFWVLSSSLPLSGGMPGTAGTAAPSTAFFTSCRNWAMERPNLSQMCSTSPWLEAMPFTLPSWWLIRTLASSGSKPYVLQINAKTCTALAYTARTWAFVFAPLPNSIQLEPPVYLMVAGSVISKLIKVLLPLPFAPLPQWFAFISKGKSW